MHGVQKIVENLDTSRTADVHFGFQDHRAIHRIGFKRVIQNSEIHEKVNWKNKQRVRSTKLLVRISLDEERLPSQILFVRIPFTNLTQRIMYRFVMYCII
jgi:hypothetical protein